MNLAEAISLMKQGKKLTHRFFEPHEWATLEDHNIVHEDECRYALTEFLALRTGPSWQTGWEEWEDPSILKEEPLPIPSKAEYERRSNRLVFLLLWLFLTIATAFSAVAVYYRYYYTPTHEHKDNDRIR